MISGGATLIFDVILKSTVDAWKDETIDIEVGADGSINEKNLVATFISFLKGQFMKHRQGSFITNGVKYKV